MGEGKKTGRNKRNCSKKERIWGNKYVLTMTVSAAESRPVLYCQQILIKSFRQNMFQPFIKRPEPPTKWLSWGPSALEEGEGCNES